MFKIKPERTADCVVAGYRVHKSGPDRIGSLLLGLYGEDGTLASVGVIGAFPMERRKELFEEMQPLVTTFDDHPWAWAKQEEGTRTPRNAEGSRWAAGKDLSFTPVAPGARRRGALRPYGGRPVPTHGAVRPLASGPRSALLHLRAARGAGELRPCRCPGRGRAYLEVCGHDPQWSGNLIDQVAGEERPVLLQQVREAERVAVVRRPDLGRCVAACLQRGWARSSGRDRRGVPRPRGVPAESGPPRRAPAGSPVGPARPAPSTRSTSPVPARISRRGSREVPAALDGRVLGS